MPGGSLNVAHNIRTMGGTVYPCGVVGRDLEGRMLLKTMRREGIETGGIVYDASRRTSVKTRVIAHSQQVVRFDRERCNEISRLDTQKILNFVRKKIQDFDVVIIEDYGKGSYATVRVVTPIQNHRLCLCLSLKQNNNTHKLLYSFVANHHIFLFLILDI